MTGPSRPTILFTSTSLSARADNSGAGRQAYFSENGATQEFVSERNLPLARQISARAEICMEFPLIHRQQLLGSAENPCEGKCRYVPTICEYLNSSNPTTAGNCPDDRTISASISRVLFPGREFRFDPKVHCAMNFASGSRIPPSPHLCLLRLFSRQNKPMSGGANVCPDRQLRYDPKLFPEIEMCDRSHIFGPREILFRNEIPPVVGRIC
jgi:hypothetical protein